MLLIPFFSDSSVNLNPVSLPFPVRWLPQLKNLIPDKTTYQTNRKWFWVRTTSCTSRGCSILFRFFFHCLHNRHKISGHRNELKWKKIPMCLDPTGAGSRLSLAPPLLPGKRHRQLHREAPTPGKSILKVTYHPINVPYRQL